MRVWIYKQSRILRQSSLWGTYPAVSSLCVPLRPLVVPETGSPQVYPIFRAAAWFELWPEVLCCSKDYGGKDGEMDKKDNMSNM